MHRLRLATLLKTDEISVFTEPDKTAAGGSNGISLITQARASSAGEVESMSTAQPKACIIGVLGGKQNVFFATRCL